MEQEKKKDGIDIEYKNAEKESKRRKRRKETKEEQRERRHIKKRSLKRRIKKTMTISNFISFAVILAVVCTAFGIAMITLANEYAEYTAKQIAMSIREPMIHGDIEETVDQLIALDLAVNNYEVDNYVVYKGSDSHNMKRMGNEDDSLGFPLVNYKVIYQEEIIHDSVEAVMDMWVYDLEKKPTIFTKMFDMREVVILHKGKPIGKVQARLSPILGMMLMSILAIVLIGVLVVNGIVNNIFITILKRLVISPLHVLHKEMKSLANTGMEEGTTDEIHINKPVYEVHLLTLAMNEIIDKFNEHTTVMTSQNNQLEKQTYELEEGKTELEAQRDELSAQRDTLEEQNIELEAQKEELEAQKMELYQQKSELIAQRESLQNINDAYLSRTKKLQIILDNVGQGFLTFNKELIIDNEYSKESSSMLSCCERELFDSKIVDVLKLSEEDKQFHQELYTKIFESSLDKRELYMSLLPDEMTMAGKHLQVEHKMVTNQKNEEMMLVILTDITEKLALQKQLDKERSQLHMIVKILSNRDEFLQIWNEYHEFAAQDFTNLSTEYFDETLRDIHTFKGSFAQYYLESAVERLNILEDELFQGEDMEKERMASLSEKELLDFLCEERKIIMDYAGEDFFHNNLTFTLSLDRIMNVEKRVKEILPANEFHKVLPEIRSLRYKSVSSQMEGYSDYVITLGDRLNKPMHPIAFKGDPVLVDSLYFQDFFKSLVHVFRNAIDHGIEDVEERVALDKEEKGTITCEVVDNGNTFVITISDNGKGIQKEKLKEKIVKKKVATKEQLDRVSDTTLFEFLFMDGVSTKEQATSVSGRGVGLSAVKEATSRLGGAIEVFSKENKGTRIQITLPHSMNVQESYAAKDFLHNLGKITSTYFEELKIDISDWELYQEDILTLNSISCLIRVKGHTDALMILSLNMEIGKELVKSFVIDEVEEEEIPELVEEVIGEVTNTILGNALAELETKGIYMTIGIPAVIQSSEAQLKHSKSQILRTTAKIGKDEIHLSLLFLDEDTMLDSVINLSEL